MIYLVITTLSSLYSGSERIVRRAWFHFLLWTHFNISDKIQCVVFIHQYDISLWVSNVAFDALTLMVGIRGIRWRKPTLLVLYLFWENSSKFYFISWCVLWSYSTFVFSFVKLDWWTGSSDATGRFFFKFLVFFLHLRLALS